MAHDDDDRELMTLASACELMLADIAEIRHDRQALLDEIRSLCARLELSDCDDERGREEFRTSQQNVIRAEFDASAERLDTVLSSRLGTLEQKADLLLKRSHRRE